MDIESALQELGQVHKVAKDDLVPDLLVLTLGTDLHDHPLVLSGSLVLQGRASCMVAVALGPEPGWEVLDACLAPGNKTVHLAALMGGKGKIIDCELNKDRVEHLEDTIKRCGASNVVVLHTKSATDVSSPLSASQTKPPELKAPSGSPSSVASAWHPFLCGLSSPTSSTINSL